MRLALCFLLAGTLAPPALAQTAADRAKAAYDKGVEHFKAKNFRDAIVEFNKAYRHDKSPVLVYNMARAFEELKDYDSAIEFYRKYLEFPDVSDRESVEQSVRTLELLRKDKVAKVDYTVNSVPSGAAVRIDGTPSGTTPLTVKLDPGEHVVDIEKAGFEKQQVKVVLANAPVNTSVTLKEIPAPAATVAETPATEEPAVKATVEPVAETNPWPWVAIGSGVALAVAAVFTGLKAQENIDTLDDADNNPGNYTEDEVETARSDGKTWALATDILAVAGGAAIVTGVVLLLTGEESATAGFSPMPGEAYGLQWEARF